MVAAAVPALASWVWPALMAAWMGKDIYFGAKGMGAQERTTKAQQKLQERMMEMQGEATRRAAVGSKRSTATNLQKLQDIKGEETNQAMMMAASQIQEQSRDRQMAMLLQLMQTQTQAGIQKARSAPRDTRGLVSMMRGGY